MRGSSVAKHTADYLENKWACSMEGFVLDDAYCNGSYIIVSDKGIPLSRLKTVCEKEKTVVLEVYDCRLKRAIKEK